MTAARIFPLVPRRRFVGASFGRNRSVRRGQGDEVVGSRPYRPGDHVAWIDWAASARLSAARGTDEFVVREYLAQEAPRATIVVDRRPSLGLYGPDSPWLDKPAAVLAAAEAIAASAVAALGEVAYLDNPARDSRAFWLPPAGRRRVAEVRARLADASFTAPPGALELGLQALLRHGHVLPPGSFVFVLSDFLAPVRSAEWARLRALRWDVVPVIVQDPTWEQSFPDVHGAVVPFADPATGKVAPTRFTRREVRALALEHERRLDRTVRTFRHLGCDPVVVGSEDAFALACSVGGKAAGAAPAGRVRLLPILALALVLAAPAAAAGADREVFFGDAFQLDAGDPAPFERLPDGRLACMSDACANRTVTVGGVTVRVLPRVTAKQVAATQPAYRAPSAVPASAGDGRADELLLAGAAVLALCSAILAASALRGRRGQAPVDRLLRALRLVRESADRSAPDRRRALDHLAATLGDAPPADRATRLAWSRPEPEPGPTRALAEDVVR